MVVCAITVCITLRTEIEHMKYAETPILSTELKNQATQLGERMARLRRARGIRQADAALRAGLSRSTAVRIEAGDPGRTVGQLLRYLDALAPGATLLSLLEAKDPALVALGQAEATRRVRKLSAAEIKDLDF